jgi:hypothetical protein
MEALERWLEPQLAEGEELAHLAGWAHKLPGLVARIAGILHQMQAVDRPGRGWEDAVVSAATVSAAVQIGRDYALPHALAAFGLMGADQKTEAARRLWESICRRCESSEYSESAPPTVSRRDLHQWNRKRFDSAEQLEPTLAVLVSEDYLRPVQGSGQAGRGHKSPRFWVNPLALAARRKEDPRTHRTHCTQNGDGPGDAFDG